MTNINRISGRISKLSDSQIQALFESMSNDNNVLSSIIESLTSGILVVDSNWNTIFSNKAGERFIMFGSHYDSSIEKIPLFEIVKDKDIAGFFKNCFDLNKTNAKR